MTKLDKEVGRDRETHPHERRRARGKKGTNARALSKRERNY